MQRKGDYIRRLCGVAAAVSLLCAAWPASAEAPSSADAPPESVTAAAAAGETASYADYRAAYPAAPEGSRIVLTPESAWEADGDGVTTQTDVQGEPSCWYLPESTTLRLRVEAAAAGRYTLRLRYLPAEGKGVELERALRVNGAVPYEEASHLLLPRALREEMRAAGCAGRQATILGSGALAACAARALLDIDADVRMAVNDAEAERRVCGMLSAEDEFELLLPGKPNLAGECDILINASDDKTCT